MSDQIIPLQIDTERRGPDAIVRLRGSVSIAQAESLRQKMESLASEEIPRIVLVLSEMDFICSAGLGAIISGHVKSRHHQGRICLVNPTPAVRQLLETTRLTKLFGVYETVEQALAA
jgi:anti-sigma B factor antagonist